MIPPGGGEAVRERLEGVFHAALEAVDAGRCVRAALRRDGRAVRVAGRELAPGARVVVLALGKAGAAMARAAEEALGDALAEGLAVVPDGCGLPLARCALREASHPLPDARGEAATREVLALAARTGPADVLLALLSGGASSLLCAPAPGLTREALADTAAVLLGAGASIDETNAVRKHLAAATGGRLAARAGAGRIEVLVVSDVVGDRLDVIGSGPFAPDPTTYAEALAVLTRRRLAERVPEVVRRHLEAGVRGEREETPGPGALAFARVRHTLLATNALAVRAAVERARELGYRAAEVGTALRGEARRAGARLAALADAVAADPAGRPTCLVAGGETVVTLRGGGRGGRSQELALAAALALVERPGAALLAAGTDGADGPTDAAGAFADAGTVERGRRTGVDAAACLADNDSHRFFAAEGGLVRTGPTRTNVMDLALLHVPPCRVPR